MKVGDVVPVTVAGHVVAQAQVTELGEGSATLVVPATKVIMGVRTEFDLPNQPTAPDTSGTEHQVLGLETENGSVDTPVVGSDANTEVVGQSDNNDPAGSAPSGNGDGAGVPVDDAGNVSTVDSEGGTSEDTA